MHNLAGNPQYGRTLREMREKVRTLMKQQHDEGRVYGKPRLRQDTVKG
jgi:hypothetical protein